MIRGDMMVLTANKQRFLNKHTEHDDWGLGG